MKRTACGLLFVLAFLACKDEHPPPALVDGGIQKMDAETFPDATPADPGSLVTVSVSSTVGVLLEDLPVAIRDRAASEIIAKNQAWWTERAKRQLRLTALRLVYRDLYYEETENKGSLTLPPEPVMTFTFSSNAAKRLTLDGHDLVAIPYTMTSALLSDVDSPGISEPALADIGGAWDEPFVFPIDPTMLLQRTGYACMDEDEFPPESVDDENAYEFYDHECSVESEDELSCHLTFPLPTETCTTAVARAIGRVETSVHYERVAWNAALADSVRSGEITQPAAADLKVVTTGFQSLSNNHILYAYFPDDHCAIAENCVGAPGWRRLLAFDSIDQNVGALPLHIGEVDYYVEGLGSDLILHNVYELSECHHHYHFQHYGDFTFGSGSGMRVQKNGFCLETTGRSSNNESSPLHTPYNCHFQGVAPGWVDLYAAGLTCNWIDITDVDTSSTSVTDMLTFHSNPDGFLCEGTLEKDQSGNQEWESTTFTSATGQPVDRPACMEADGTEGNDIGMVPVTVPVRGGIVSQPCTDDQVLSPSRNCGFRAVGAGRICVPGSSVTIQCTGDGQVIRVCEGSAKLGDGVDCYQTRALANAVLENGATDLTFDCPGMRDANEPGGRYAIFTAPALATDTATTSVICTP